MSNESLQSNPAVLQTEGKNLNKVGTDFAAAVTSLQAALKAAGEEEGRPPWGNDDIGSSFGALYKGFRDGMVESMGHLAGRIDDIGTGLTGMGDNHEVNENFNDSLVKAEESKAKGKGIGSISGPGGG